MFYCLTLHNSQDFQSKIPKIFNFWSSERHQACLFGRVENLREQVDMIRHQAISIKDIVLMIDTTHHHVINPRSFEILMPGIKALSFPSKEHFTCLLTTSRLSNISSFDSLFRVGFILA